MIFIFIGVSTSPIRAVIARYLRCFEPCMLVSWFFWFDTAFRMLVSCPLGGMNGSSHECRWWSFRIFALSGACMVRLSVRAGGMSAREWPSQGQGCRFRRCDGGVLVYS